jgi:hypothetical protein
LPIVPSRSIAVNVSTALSGFDHSPLVSSIGRSSRSIGPLARRSRVAAIRQHPDLGLVWPLASSPSVALGYRAPMSGRVILETLAGDVALLRDELRCVLETLMRLDNQAAKLEQRLIAIRDENQDTTAQLRDVRLGLAATNRLQNTIGARLDRIEAELHPVPPA